MPAESVARPVRTPELAALSVLSALLHFWRLFTPRAVVFDEMHYKHFAGHYLDHTHYYDVHPPLAKLLYALVAKVSGVSAETMLGPDPVVVLRLVPALLGTLVVPLVYVILRQLGAARRIATFGALALLLENALLVDARFALIEPILIGFGLIAITCFLAARERRGVARWVLLAVCAIVGGLALSAKWTGASALGLILATWALDAWRERPPIPRLAGEGALLSIAPAAVYVATFAVHFALIQKVGPDLPVMSGRYQSTLIDSPQYDPAVRMSFLAKVGELHDAMRRGNRALESVTHPASSPWYTWPIMKHPIAMWQDVHPPTKWQANIVLLGNPAVWWGSLGVFALAALAWVRDRNRFAGHRFALAFLTGGFVINFAPFIAIRRVMYLYHYLFALVFLVMIATFAGGILVGWQNRDDNRLFSFPARRSSVIYWSAAAIIVVGFLYFLPFTFGWSLTEPAFEQRFRVLHPF